MSWNFWKIENTYLLKERFASILGCFRWLLLFFLFLLLQPHLHNLSNWKKPFVACRPEGQRPQVATHSIGSPRWLSGKESARNAGDEGLIAGWRRSPGEGNGNPLQYSCLGNPMGRETWRTTVHGVTKSQTWLSTYTWAKALVSQEGFTKDFCEAVEKRDVSHTNQQPPSHTQIRH